VNEKTSYIGVVRLTGDLEIISDNDRIVDGADGDLRTRGRWYRDWRNTIFDVKHHLFRGRQNRGRTIKEGVGPGAGAGFRL
jgi:hypothetical protein